ncbi:unnamed protein product [Musa textilis]
MFSVIEDCLSFSLFHFPKQLLIVVHWLLLVSITIEMFSVIEDCLSFSLFHFPKRLLIVLHWLLLVNICIEMFSVIEDCLLARPFNIFRYHKSIYATFSKCRAAAFIQDSPDCAKALRICSLQIFPLILP